MKIEDRNLRLVHCASSAGKEDGKRRQEDIEREQDPSKRAQGASDYFASVLARALKGTVSDEEFEQSEKVLNLHSSNNRRGSDDK